MAEADLKTKGTGVQFTCPHCLAGYKTELARNAHLDKCSKNPMLFDKTKIEAEQKAAEATAAAQVAAEEAKKAEADKKKKAAEEIAERKAVGIGRTVVGDRFLQAEFINIWAPVKAIEYLESKGYAFVCFIAPAGFNAVFGFFKKA